VTHASLSFSNPATRSWLAFGVAAGLEGLLLLILTLWLGSQSWPIPQQVIPLTLELMVSAAPAALGEPRKEEPTFPSPPRIAAPAADQVASVTLPQAPIPQPLAPQPFADRVEAPAANTSAPVAELNSAPSMSAALPAGTVNKADLSAIYNARLKAAVQSVFQVPAAAQALNFKGRAQVEFTIKNGVVSDIHLVKGSGFGMVDRAAIKAVESAPYPLPPQELQGHGGRYQIWVECY
jgi:TonB family protein